MKKILVLMVLFISFGISELFAQGPYSHGDLDAEVIDRFAKSEKFTLLSIGYGLAIDKGEGKGKPQLLVKTRNKNFLKKGLILDLLFNGMMVKAGISRPKFLNTNNELGISLYGKFMGSYQRKYIDGDFIEEESFQDLGFGSRIKAARELTKGLKAEMSYNVFSHQYTKDVNASADFVLPTDNLTQTGNLRLRWKKIIEYESHRLFQGLDYSIMASYSLRDKWEAWGPEDNTYEAKESKDYQKYRLSLLNYFLYKKDHLLKTRISGGYGEDLDQLSRFKLGGLSAVDGLIHGYYFKELLADKFFLINLQYSKNLYKTGKEDIKGLLYFDLASLNNKDKNNNDWQEYKGIGVGINTPFLFKSRFSIDFGYGIDAIRQGDKGGYTAGFLVKKIFL